MTEVKEDLSILQYATQHDVKFSTSLLKSIRYLVYDPKSLTTVVTYINKCLANASTRELGFDLILKTIEDFPQHILDDNAKNWVGYAVSKHQNETIAACRFQFLVEIFAKCHGNQDFHKAIVSNLLPKIVDTCLWVHIKSSNALNSLNCLYNAMKFFSSSCIVHKKKIEDYVLQFLDASSKIVVVSEAAKCYLILNQIGGAGPNGSIHIKNFEDNFEKMYKTLNVLYDSMFENINEFREAKADENVDNIIQFKEIPTYLSTLDVYKILARRMGNVVIFLIQMLQGNFSVRKTIKPELLSVIQRGLDIHVHGDVNDPTRTLFNQSMQEHQIKLLFFLKALIQSMQRNFMRHITIKMLVRYLTRASECNCYRINNCYKSTIYNVITFWLERSGEQIDSKTYEQLIEVIIKDITPNKSTLVLQINIDKNSKANKNADANITEENSPRILQTREANCKAALDLLEVLFKLVHLNISRVTITKLFDILTRTLMDICVETFIAPYTSQACRLQLAKVFTATFDQNVYTIDIDLAVNILALAQGGDDIELSLICQNALKSIEKIVHPIQPTMQIAPIEMTQNEENQNAPKEKTAVTVLRNLLIESSKTKQPEKVVDNEIVEVEMNPINDNGTIIQESTVITQENDTVVGSKVTTENVVEVLSDNEADVSIVDQDGFAIPVKKRKANDKDIIYTFDISDDPSDSFVDEIN